jgi:hypothetical protein
MLTIEIKPFKYISEAEIERLCRAEGLQLTMKGSLKSIADNVHWHYKRAGEKGVLEITRMQDDGRVILSCKNNRHGEWIEDVMKKLELALK